MYINLFCINKYVYKISYQLPIISSVSFLHWKISKNFYVNRRQFLNLAALRLVKKSFLKFLIVPVSFALNCLGLNTVKFANTERQRSILLSLQAISYIRYTSRERCAYPHFLILLKKAKKENQAGSRKRGKFNRDKGLLAPNSQVLKTLQSMGVLKWGSPNSLRMTLMK